MTVAVPQHVAIIMDGNGRWAAAKGMHRFYGHRAGADAAKTAIRCALDASIPYLSLYAFSQENRARPAKEVKELIKLYHDLLKPETVHKLCEHRVALRFVGDVAGLDTNLAEAALQAEQQTAEASPRLTVVVALNYSGRWDVLQATQALLGAQRTEAF